MLQCGALRSAKLLTDQRHKANRRNGRACSRSVGVFFKYQKLLIEAANRDDHAATRRGNRLPSRDDLDRTADRETKIAVRAPLVNGDFGKPVRILVPKGRAERPITEGPFAFQ
jgi:hypothetical protein